MGLPISKNPLITKWSTVFNILKNRTEISEEELKQLAESIGFTVSALYDMLGLTASNENVDKAIEVLEELYTLNGQSFIITISGKTTANS